MIRIASLILVMTFSLAPISVSWAQKQPAPVYSLPADGVWVEYDYFNWDKDGKKQTGVLRTSSVGARRIDGEPHRWLEFHLSRIPDDKSQVKIRKLLVAEKGIMAQASWTDQVVEGFARDGTNEPVTRMTSAGIKSFLQMGMFDAMHEEKKAPEPLETGLGKMACSYHVSRAVSPSPLLEYRGWLTHEVPFGWARFQIVERVGQAPPRLVFQATVQKTGRGANSAVVEPKAK